MIAHKNQFSDWEAMVYQSALALSAEQRKCLEEGGGTKEMTKVLRETYGTNFEQYILSREDEWCREPQGAPDWWLANERGQPRVMEELVIDSRLLGIYVKNWLWEMQVWEIFVS